MADWALHSGDTLGLPFVVVDKGEAQVFVFNREGRLLGNAPALLGLARGDDAVLGIGERPLSSISPHERTTPSGRFIASLAHNLSGDQILWVDYETSISLHPVRSNSNPKERRMQRLMSTSVQDKRISFGCINVTLNFFRDVVVPVFSGTQGVVYVLPETRSPQSVFASYDVID